MRGRAIIPMVVGLGVGFVALKVFVNVLQNAKAASTSTLVPVVYAVTNIEPTLEIQESMIEVRHVSKEAVPDTGFKDKSEVLGRVTTWPIPKGTPVAAMLLAPKGTPPGMAVMIEDGFRAVAVKIDESAGVAGWIKPGSRVDVIMLLSNPDRSKGNQSFSKVILQNVEVLAAGQELGKAGDTAAAITKTVTLKVLPNDVPKLHLAETKGRLRLAMRGQRDSSITKESVTTDNDLLSGSPTGKTVKNNSSSSLLQSIFSGQAKVGPNQTDKDKQPAATTARPVTAQPVAAPQPWTVEVYRGLDEVHKVRFEQKASAWQRLDEGRSQSPQPRKTPPAPAPISLFAPLPSQASAAGSALVSHPQAKDFGTEGPAGIQ